ncbi:MAG: ATP-binding protein [Verrucomicrobiales bacterium]|nr:ATP-binding protein [Verrucomicrobiales bacterium]
MMKSGFLDKLIEKMDKVDPAEVQRIVLRAVQEKGFLENVFDTLQEGVVVVGVRGTIHYVNNAALDFFGFTRQELLGQSLGDQFPGIIWDEIIQSNRAVNRDLEVFYPEHRFLNFYISPLEQSAGGSQIETAGYVLILRDDTQTRQVQQEEVESERIAALTMLAAGVAHELGNPLNSLNIHLQLLERKVKKKAPPELASELLESLEITRSEIKRLNFIVEKFLGAVRPTKPQFEDADVNQLVTEAVTFLAPEVKDRNITITLQLTEHLPKLTVDADQMKQVFYNLIRNGAQAIGSDGSLVISSKYDDYNVTLSFADDGHGISSEKVGKVFEPYFTTKKTGSGLGLLIVHRIVREHGGQIEFESRKNEGTTVKVMLPRAEKQVRFLPEKGGSSDVIEVDVVPG